MNNFEIFCSHCNIDSSEKEYHSCTNSYWRFWKEDNEYKYEYYLTSFIDRIKYCRRYKIKINFPFRVPTAFDIFLDKIWRKIKEKENRKKAIKNANRSK